MNTCSAFRSASAFSGEGGPSWLGNSHGTITPTSSEFGRSTLMNLRQVADFAGGELLAFARSTPEVRSALQLRDPRTFCVKLGHEVEHADGPHGVLQGAGAAHIVHRIVLSGAGQKLAGVVGQLDRAVLGVGHLGEDANHSVHLAGVVFRHTVKRDQRVEGRNIDLVVADGLDDAFHQPMIDVQVAVALCDPERDLIPRGHEEPAGKLL